MTKRIPSILIAITCLYITACSNDDSNPTPDNTKSEIINNYAAIVYKNYQDAYSAAENLQTAINAFVNTPTTVNFNNTKDAWKFARESYGQTEAFRFANGPIDDADGPEGLLNAWPLDEVYIDYVEGNSTSGIINDLTNFPTISKSILESLNEVGGEKNISVGYHAIEFLLWGQDLTTPNALLAGQRPYTDYVDGGTAANQDRRRDYLVACSDLLLDHLQLMLDEWKVNGAYRTIFLGLTEDEALKNILTGIATLAKGELAGERIFVAYNNQDQEDEHSCFSDNTDRDIRLNLQGIANVYRGTYSSVNGTSLEDLITNSNATIGAEITASLIEAETKVEATGTPFDYAISDATERPKIAAAVTALQTLGDKLVAGGDALGLNITAE